MDARAQAEADGLPLPDLVQDGAPHYWRQPERDAIMGSCVRDLLAALQPGATHLSSPPAAERMRNATVWTAERVSAQCEALGGVALVWSRLPALACAMSGSICGPHGVCDGEVCVCDGGYGGSTCSEPVGCGAPDGAGLLCSGHGVCATTPAGGVCECWTDAAAGTGYISDSAPCVASVAAGTCSERHVTCPRIVSLYSQVRHVVRVRRRDHRGSGRVRRLRPWPQR